MESNSFIEEYGSIKLNQQNEVQDSSQSVMRMLLDNPMSQMHSSGLFQSQKTKLEISLTGFSRCLQLHCVQTLTRKVKSPGSHTQHTVGRVISLTYFSSFAVAQAEECQQSGFSPIIPNLSIN